MTNRIVIGILVVVALVLSGAGFTWIKNQSSQPTVTSSPMASAQVQSSVSVQAQQLSLMDLWKSQSSQKCTFSDTSTKTSGTVYVSDGKVRGDFRINSQGQVLNSHMIVDGQTSYIWSDGMGQGMKIAMDKFASTPTATQSSQVDINKKTDYRCENWNTDNTVFTIPADMQFNDMSSLVPNASGMMDGKAAQCAACDRLSGVARAQCKSALSC